MIYAGSFLLVSTFASFLVENYGGQSSTNSVEGRFESIDTLSDRTHSTALFSQIWAEDNLLGKGYAASFSSSGRGFEGAELTEEMGSHNIVVGELLATGIAGLIALALSFSGA